MKQYQGRTGYPSFFISDFLLDIISNSASRREPFCLSLIELPHNYNINAILRTYILFPSIFFQAILFYVPRWLWKNWEAGKVSALRMDLNLGIISEVEKKLKKKLLIDYLYSNLKHHNFWCYRYFFCEVLSLVNVCGKKNKDMN